MAVQGQREPNDGAGPVDRNGLDVVGISFLSLLTAVVASRFVKQERGGRARGTMETLRRIEADVAELKSRAR